MFNQKFNFYNYTTTSICGNIQVIARVLEVAIHKIHELKFPLERVIHGIGYAPLPPIAKDFITGMGRTNDAIIYGGVVQLIIDGPEDELMELSKSLPSSSSSDYGKPFKEIFKKYSDELKSSSNPPLSIMTDVQPNPDYKDILELQNKFSSINESVDYILAIGGGSVTDTAKAIAAFKDKQEYLTDFVRNKKSPRVENPIKIIAIPTTSGTSSELTCWATIWDKEKIINYLWRINLFMQKKQLSIHQLWLISL